MSDMTESEKTDLRASIKDARNAVESGYWDLAQKLHTVYTNTLFVEWGYTDWPAYIEGELDLQPRSVQYMIGIADWFGKMDPEIQAWVQTLGWSKSKELVKRVTPENWLVWKKKIAGKSVAQIQEMLKAEAAKPDGDTGATTVSEKPTRVSFALMGDQPETVKAALEKAKKEANTDKDGNAITLICQDFLASSGGVSLASRLSAIEKTFGIRVIAVKVEKDANGKNEFSYPYGENTLNELSDDDSENDAIEPEDTQSPDYDTMSAAELKKVCDDAAIPYGKKDSRALLIEKIRAVEASSGEKAAALAKSDDTDAANVEGTEDSGDSDPADSVDPDDLPGQDD